MQHIFLLADHKSTIAIIPLIFAYGLWFELIAASTSALVADVAHEGQLGASLGVLSTLMDVGQTFGPPVIGVISNIYGYATGIRALGAVLLIATISSSIALMKQQRSAE